MALPLQSHLTEEEAESLVILFGSHVPPGRPLAGRYVYSRLTMCEDEDDAVRVLCDFRERVREQVERMRKR